MDVTFFENQFYYSKTNIQGENRIQECQFWETKNMIELQTLESVIVHNSNPIFLALSFLLQTTESVDTESSIPLCQIVYSYFSYLLFLFFPYCIVGPTNMYIYTQVQCVSLIVFNNKNQGFSLFSLFTWYQSLGRKKT